MERKIQRRPVPTCLSVRHRSGLVARVRRESTAVLVPNTSNAWGTLAIFAAGMWLVHKAIESK